MNTTDRIRLCVQVMEFGAGDGSPVINCLTGRSFDGVVHGFEINPQAAALARVTAARHGLGEKYQVRNESVCMSMHTMFPFSNLMQGTPETAVRALQIHGSCFFKAAESMGASTLIANPPYIPAPDKDIMMPALHGGTDGAQLTRVCGYPCRIVASSCALKLGAVSKVSVHLLLPVQRPFSQGDSCVVACCAAGLDGAGLPEPYPDDCVIQQPCADAGACTCTRLCLDQFPGHAAAIWHLQQRAQGVLAIVCSMRHRVCLACT